MRVMIQGNEIQKHFDKEIIEDSDFPDYLVDYMQDNYFNGADNAIIYLGYSEKYDYYEIDILPG